MLQHLLQWLPGYLPLYRGTFTLPQHPGHHSCCNSSNRCYRRLCITPNKLQHLVVSPPTWHSSTNSYRRQPPAPKLTSLCIPLLHQWVLQLILPLPCLPALNPRFNAQG